eukprot:4884322-Lingulodinium_polyedra.AAC.1
MRQWGHRGLPELRSAPRVQRVPAVRPHHQGSSRCHSPQADSAPRLVGAASALPGWGRLTVA